MRRIHVADLTLGEAGCSAKSNLQGRSSDAAASQMPCVVSVRVFPNDSFWGFLDFAFLKRDAQIPTGSGSWRLVE
jgi:hypothetical protein